MSLLPRSFTGWMDGAIFQGELGCVGKLDDARTHF